MIRFVALIDVGIYGSQSCPLLNSSCILGVLDLGEWYGPFRILYCVCTYIWTEALICRSNDTDVTLAFTLSAGDRSALGSTPINGEML